MVGTVTDETEDNFFELGEALLGKFEPGFLLALLQESCNFDVM
jgi:hypothetical protein